MYKQVWLGIVSSLLIVLNSCSMAELTAPMPKASRFLSPLALPQHTAYVLSGILGGTNTFWLTLLDADTWQVIRRVQLPQSYTTHLSRDPQGRLWIGYLGLDWPEYRMQVFASDGRLLQTLHPCRDPESGVQFASGKAFVMCDENGFYATVAVLDLATLAFENTLHIDVPNNPYTIYSSYGDGNYILILGILSGPKEIGYTGVTFIAPYSQSLKVQTKIFEAARISEALSYQGKYYLLNAESWRSSRNTATDILVMTPSNPLSVQTMITPAPSPVWGKIISDTLFSYHNPTWFQLGHKDPQRMLSRLALKTGVSQVWPLPDNWDANDLEVVNGKIILLTNNGLYEFNPADGQLQKRVDIAYARQIIVTP